MSVLDFQHRRLIPAGDLSDSHIGREVRVHNVEGVLIGLYRVANEVRLTLAIGRSNALFALDPAATVEIGRKP